MKKNQIICYLNINLMDGIDYQTEAVFLDKAHKMLLSFSCGTTNPGKSMVSVVRE